MADGGLDVGKIAQALDALDAAIAEAQAVARALRRVVEGMSPTQAIIVRWKERWRVLYGGAYTVTKADAGQLDRLVKEIGADELRTRLGRYLKDRDPWVLQRRHSLSVFVSRVNDYGAAAEIEAPTVATAVGCLHSPRCTSDTVHTQRMLAEARG